MGYVRSLTSNSRSHVYTIAAAGTKTAWKMERLPARKHLYTMTLLVSMFVAVYIACFYVCCCLHCLFLCLLLSTLLVSMFVAVYIACFYVCCCLYDECCKLSVSAVSKERSLIISVLFLTLWKLSGNLWSHYSVPARLTARRQRLSCSAQPIFGEGWQPDWCVYVCVCVGGGGGGGGLFVVLGGIACFVWYVPIFLALFCLNCKVANIWAKVVEVDPCPIAWVVSVDSVWLRLLG